MDARGPTVSSEAVRSVDDAPSYAATVRLPVWILACPRGHIVIPRFDVAELRADLERGEVRAVCKRCKASLALSSNQLATLRHWLSAPRVDDDLGK
jgi:hypothetical protein